MPKTSRVVCLSLRSSGVPVKPMKMRILQPALHLLVHVAALGAVAFIHEDVEPPVHRRRRAVEVGESNLWISAHSSRGVVAPSLLDKLRARGDAGRRRISAR